MKKMDIRFGETQKLMIDDCSQELGMNQSVVARSALYLGMIQIRKGLCKDKDKIQDLIRISDARARQ